MSNLYYHVPGKCSCLLKITACPTGDLIRSKYHLLCNTATHTNIQPCQHLIFTDRSFVLIWQLGHHTQRHPPWCDGGFMDRICTFGVEGNNSMTRLMICCQLRQPNAVKSLLEQNTISRDNKIYSYQFAIRSITTQSMSAPLNLWLVYQDNFIMQNTHKWWQLQPYS